MAWLIFSPEEQRVFGYMNKAILNVLLRKDRTASILYNQTCVKRPIKARHIFGFSDRWLLIAA